MIDITLLVTISAEPFFEADAVISVLPGIIPVTFPALSALASFFLPGLGSMINGDVAKGIGILIGYFISWVLVIVLVGIVGVLGFWVWGMVDAAEGARRWNARHGILS